jgi:hypothetical protein
MSENGAECVDCAMVFESEQQLGRHRAKFCLNSKYSNEELLKEAFQTLSHRHDISLLAKHPNRSLLDPAASSIRSPAVQSFLSPSAPEGQIDREYRALLREIGEREDLRNKL